MARANLLALGAILLWGTLAPMSVALSHLPPFLLTGLSLLVGGLLALPLSGFDLRAWRVPLPTVALGVYGLFGYHFMLFMALRHAPPVQANLVNYLWPLGIVLMSPWLVPGTRLKRQHVIAALAGFTGAALAITGGQAIDATPAWGYAAALAAAFMWSSYSLLTQRVARFATHAIGLFALISAALSLLCHLWLEPRVALGGSDAMLVMLMGAGPLGAAFYLWDAALKRGDARQIGLLSFLTPLLSTAGLLLLRDQAPDGTIAAATALIVGAAWLGSREQTLSR